MIVPAKCRVCENEFYVCLYESRQFAEQGCYNCHHVDPREGDTVYYLHNASEWYVTSLHNLSIEEEIIQSDRNPHFTKADGYYSSITELMTETIRALLKLGF